MDGKMNEHEYGALSRRALIKGGMRTLAGIAVVSLMGTRALAAETKLAKSVVQYEDVAKRSARITGLGVPDS